MADRKQFENVPAVDPELTRLLQNLINTSASEEELRAQRISFAFGNALNLERITKASVRAASENIKLR